MNQRCGEIGRGPAEAFRGPAQSIGSDQTVNELPQPHPPEEFGLLKVKPDP
jgi:hypothetical protein